MNIDITKAYKIIENDQTIEKIRYAEMFYDYDETKPMVFDDTYQQLYDSITSDQDLLKYRGFPIKGVNKRKIKESIKLWESFGIELYDVDILDRKFDLRRYNGIMTQEFLDAILTEEPSRIPVVFKKSERPDAKNELLEIATNDFENKGVIFKRIILPVISNEVTSCHYGHEIAHTQLFSIGNGTNSFLNAETIPILIEQLFAHKLDPSGETLKRLRYFRLNELANMLYTLARFKNIAFVTKVEHDMYIQSTLQAIQLANTYFSATTDVKMEMLEYINKIFEENLLIEDLLTHFECSLESVPKDIKIFKMTK